MLIFAPDVLQTFPDYPARSDWMRHFVEGHLGKPYGVCLPFTIWLMVLKWVHPPQLSCSKMLFKQEEEIMREFGKIKVLLDTADVDEDEWDRTRGSCELLGGRLQQIREAL